MRTYPRRPIQILLGVGVLIATLATPALSVGPSSPGRELDPNAKFAFAIPNPGAVRQIAQLLRDRKRQDAALIGKMIATPQAEWFTQGTPRQVKRDTQLTVRLAQATGRVPVLVAYNIPFRDCAQFSAGGATTVDEYLAWIDGFAAGIGNAKAVVILEPDGLGIIPWYDPYGSADGSNALEWCQPAEADPATAAAERFLMLNAAVDRLLQQPRVSVYLDGTHSAWLGVGDVAHRLAQAGIARAQGFYLNVSNYQFTGNSVQYGTWVSSCLAYATAVVPGDFFGCPNQYWNGGPLPSLIAQTIGEWTGDALNNYGEWSATDTRVVATPGGNRMPFNTSGINQRYANMLGATPATTRFVIDTSRNGLGPWNAVAAGYATNEVAQDWCNPPDRGLGLRPTANTGVPLVDAYLWVKTPGESDGECTRGLGPSGTTVDPEWGRIDPGAGDWFPEQALELARLANPPLN